jgi:hypothetical protein
VAHLEELIPLTIRLSGIVQGPLLGLFTLGVLFPKVNSKVGTNHNVDNTFFFIVERLYWNYLWVSFSVVHDSTCLLLQVPQAV